MAVRIRPMKQPFFVVVGAALACATVLASQAQAPQNANGGDALAIRQRLDVVRKSIPQMASRLAALIDSSDCPYRR